MPDTLALEGRRGTIEGWKTQWLARVDHQWECRFSVWSLAGAFVFVLAGLLQSSDVLDLIWRPWTTMHRFPSWQWRDSSQVASTLSMWSKFTRVLALTFIQRQLEADPTANQTPTEDTIPPTNCHDPTHRLTAGCIWCSNSATIDICKHRNVASVFDDYLVPLVLHPIARRYLLHTSGLILSRAFQEADMCWRISSLRYCICSRESRIERTPCLPYEIRLTMDSDSSRSNQIIMGVLQKGQWTHHLARTLPPGTRITHSDRYRTAFSLPSSGPSNSSAHGAELHLKKPIIIHSI